MHHHGAACLGKWNTLFLGQACTCVCPLPQGTPPPKNVERDIYEYVDRKNKDTFFTTNKPIGALPGPDYVLTRMVLQIILYSTRYGMIHQKRGGTLRGLRIKREREEYVGILILRKPH